MFRLNRTMIVSGRALKSLLPISREGLVSLEMRTTQDCQCQATTYSIRLFNCCNSSISLLKAGSHGVVMNLQDRANMTVCIALVAAG